MSGATIPPDNKTAPQNKGGLLRIAPSEYVMLDQKDFEYVANLNREGKRKWIKRNRAALWKRRVK